MSLVPLLNDEECRVSNLNSYGILDTAPENEFEDIVLLASAVCDTPCSYIGFMDLDRLWFKSKLGFQTSEISLKSSLCKFVLESKQALLVEDLDSDDRFSQLSLIHEGQKIRFYLGLPLKSPEGFILGTLCVVDYKPRKLCGKQISSLAALSRQIVQNLILRKASVENVMTNKTSALGMFTFSMAHEINNALFASNGYVYYAMKQCLGGKISVQNLESLLTKIKKSNSRISKIVNGIKIFSRNAENDPFESISIKKIIEDTLSICEERCKLENIILSIHLPVDDYCIDCHPSEIIQVLINLINNSIDAVAEVKNKWIELEVKPVDEKLEFSVKDSGVGIPKDVAQNLTNLFFTTKDSGKGTGLGLYICKSIIELHSGQFFFDSALPTKFGFTLPRKL